MCLADLAEAAELSVPREVGTLDIARVTEDSRRVQPGALFVATSGGRSDGHDFAAQAVEAGAVAILGGCEGVSQLAGVPYLYHPHPRRALGLMAHRLVGDPSEAMCVVGVTGTNGKTSVVTLIAHVLNHAGHRAARFGTVGYDIADEHLPAPHTTPFGEDLAALFALARDRGMSHVAMEACSHALEQERVAGVHFTGAVFTNLTQDHLDYHGDMDTYRDAKVRLFDRVGADGFGVANMEDPAYASFLACCRGTRCTVGRGGDVRASHVVHGDRRTCFRVETPWGAEDISTALLGAHNVSNTLMAIAACGSMGLPMDVVAEALAEAVPVAGRFEVIDAGQPFRVVVDYAHTDDGLRNVLQAARAICDGRILVVFGCGGDRDRTKRPKMGAVAAELADYLVVTSDNPRTEDPDAIIREILPGIGRVQGGTGHCEVIVDREAAIFHAIAQAGPGDLVMIAGKGHEDYQILGTQKIHFDDREVARKALQGR
jgi:UDP-N-acetylmuramoyl-L-alanyl-D-glutamate--2,6-diaminopimelate ligase